MSDSFYEMAIKQAEKQKILIDCLVEDAQILKGMPVEASNTGFQNVYEKIIDVNGAGLVDIDGVLATMNVDTKLETTKLGALGGKMTVPEQHAEQMGGFDAYFAKRLPPLLASSGAQTEKSIIYNNLRAYAITNSNTVTATGDANTNYSIVCVRYKPGEITGLYNPQDFGRGAFFDIKKLNGGTLYDIGSGQLGYGMRIRSNIGVQLANENYVSALVNIDFVNKAAGFTAEKVDEIITNARGLDGRGLLIMHPNVYGYMKKFKADKLQVFPDTKNIGRSFSFWDGTRIMLSYNFLQGSEANV